MGTETELYKVAVGKMAVLNDGVGITCTAQTAGSRFSKYSRPGEHSVCPGFGAR